MITDGDIRRILEKKVDIYSIKASDIMNNNPKVVNINSLAADSLNIMKKNNISQLLVVNDLKEYVGVVHFLDLIKEGING